MARLIVLKDHDGEFILNIDAISRIIPINNQQGSSCELYLINQPDNIPINIRIPFQELLQLLEQQSYL